MGPEERLEALRDDARWRPIALYPEHGRMPAPVRAQPWRVVVGTAIVLAVVAAVFGGVSVFRSLGNQTVPMPIAGAPTVTRSPVRLPVAQLLGEAKLPPGASPGANSGANNALPLPFANDGSVCGAVSEDASFWTVAGLSAASAMSWLGQHPQSALGSNAIITQMNADDVVERGYQLGATDPPTGQGLLVSVVSIPDFGVAIRVDALDLPQGSECVSDRLSGLAAESSPAATDAASEAEQAALQAAREAAEHAYNAGH
ncbi:hypothetical protein [Gryllotalpicola protaetiae]|uniref:Uncharacterized protein n=1 Tax=Gryllotalpicola protaetiae TaxID=2419771 RepID=A0A387BFP2_9MICO|nr:hypothetical protein [Gryllotalpicola protaetiae]AYG02743.1 hypothetical protein D7I44_03870 [Gryllotalpicola protaetiae]